MDMTRGGGLSAHDHVASQSRRAGDPDLGHQQGIFADHDIMADLHQVVDLDPGLDPGLPVGRPVDAGIGPDLDVIVDPHDTHLGPLDMPAAGICGIAVAVGADHHPGMDGHPAADAATPKR